MGGDCGGDGLQKDACDFEAQKNSQAGAQQGKEEGFADDENDDGTAVHPERSEEAEFGASAGDIGSNGIGDEKHAYDQSDQGEGGEVELEGTEHFFHFLSPAFGGTGPGVSGEVWGEAVEQGGANRGYFSRGIRS